MSTFISNPFPFQPALRRISEDVHMAGFLSPEQKQMLGPFLAIGIFFIAVAFGIAINTIAGGPKVPGISEFAGIIVGVVAALVAHKSLSK